MHFPRATESVKVSVYAKQLTSFRSQSGRTSYILQKHLIIFFQKWLRHFRAKISLFENGVWGLSIQGGILLCCVQCWPPDMYTVWHKSSSCASENVTQSTQCSENRVLWGVGPVPV